MRLEPIVIAIGFLLAAYAYYVEYRFEEAKRMGTSYKAACDIGIFSCTKVFSSEFGYASQFFGLPKIPNSLAGMAFYTAQLLVERHTPLLLLSSIVSCIGSIALFYILTVKLNDFCIVCFSVYVVNFTTLFLAYRRWKQMGQEYRAKQTGKKTN
jgi:vitamin-K-epoxide reductase (warfarin-sensitive)